MKQIVIGLGEVGQAIQRILQCDGYDATTLAGVPIYVVQDPSQSIGLYDVLHICIPYSESFQENVLKYIEKYNAKLVVVHSTVPVDTCDAHGWVHSPVRGVHPDLEKGIRTFVKFFGGLKSFEASKLFAEKGIKTHSVQYAKNTEAMKLWDTTIYGWNILIEKAIKAYCERNGLDFETVYTYANGTYNTGYGDLGHSEFKKYILKDFPGPIGGHCVKENWGLLDDPIAEISKQLHKDLTDV